MLNLVLTFLAVPASLLIYAALIGLGFARQAEPGAVALAATVLLFGPALLAALPARSRRLGVFTSVQLIWSVMLFQLLPVYFPGERRESVATGLAVLLHLSADDPRPRALANRLPEEPDLAKPRLEVAGPVIEPVAPPPGPLEDHEIALPYEGEGRRLSVPVVFEHDGHTVETFMMLDTGATYTTLTHEVLAVLGATPSDDAPVLTLNTANGERRAQVALLDRVWLGDLILDGVAVTTCEDCASPDNSGLLGLNIAGGFNVTIDADRREVVFSARNDFNRHLDIRPFADLDGRFTRYPGSRVELALDIANHSPRTIQRAQAQVKCGAEAWIVDFASLGAGATGTVQRRLPSHEPCLTYEISLEAAWW